MNNATAVLNTPYELEHLSAPVGTLARDTFISIPIDATVGEALDRYRILHEKIERNMGSILFVCNKDNQYCGFVRLSALVLANSEEKVFDLIEDKTLFVRKNNDSENAARLLQRKDLPMLPILETDSDRLLGVLRFDDAMDILEIESSDDVYFKAGIGDVTHMTEHVRSERLTQGHIGYAVKVRMAFLLVTLVGGVMVGGVINHFQNVLSSIVALAIFIPLIMDMGGNVGTQSTTIFARGLALGHIDMRRFFSLHVWREIKVGISMGLILALLGGFVAYVWQGAPNDIPMLGVVVGISLLVSITIACLLGFLLPWALLKLGFDHAPGADPFITTIKDFTGLAVYFTTAGWLLGVSA